MRTYERTLAGLLALAPVLAASAAHAAEAPRAIATSGQTVVTNGDLRGARARAYFDAQRKAVAAVVQQLGGPAEGTDGSLDHALYARSPEFVIRTDLVSENVDLNILAMDAKVLVNVAAVRVALGARAGSAPTRGGRAVAATGTRRVLILATEQLGPRHVFGWTNYAWGWGSGSSQTTMVQGSTDMGGIEAVFSDVLGQGGFEVIDPHVLYGKLSPRPAFQVLDLQPAEARAIAAKSDADYVVVAKGIAKDAYHATVAAGGMYSGQGNVVVRLIRMSDGKVLASSTQHAAQVHIDLDTARLNALNEAARMAAQELLTKVNND